MWKSFVLSAGMSFLSIVFIDSHPAQRRFEMSAIYYCDLCEKKLTAADNQRRIKRKNGCLEVEIHVAVSGTWNGGHWCRSCVLETCANGRDVRKNDIP